MQISYLNPTKNLICIIIISYDKKIEKGNNILLSWNWKKWKICISLKNTAWGKKQYINNNIKKEEIYN